MLKLAQKELKEFNALEKAENLQITDHSHASFRTAYADKSSSLIPQVYTTFINTAVQELEEVIEDLDKQLSELPT